MDAAYSGKVSQLFTKGSHHRNICLVLITQNMFRQVPSSRVISLNSIYRVVFKNPRDKTQIVNLARQYTLKTFLVFIKRTWRFVKTPIFILGSNTIN
jgi:hypothetical protein